MRFSRDVFVALLGGAVILTVAVGLVLIESREGAREHELEPVRHPVQVRGSFETESGQGTMGPEGSCIPDFPMTECRPARTRLDLHVEGLPLFSGDGHYVVFLVGGDEGPLLMGSLEEQEDAMVLTSDQEQDATSYEDLVITVDREPDPRDPNDLVVYQRTIGPVTDGSVDLSAETTMGVQRGGGEVRTSQTGAVTVSALVDAQMTDLPRLSGWTYHAWYVDEDRDPVAHSYLGEVEMGPDDEQATLDVRKERVRVEDQERFLVTLQPDGDVRDGPAGFPAYQAVLRSTS